MVSFEYRFSLMKNLRFQQSVVLPIKADVIVEINPKDSQPTLSGNLEFNDVSQLTVLLMDLCQWYLHPIAMLLINFKVFK